MFQKYSIPNSTCSVAQLSSLIKLKVRIKSSWYSSLEKICRLEIWLKFSLMNSAAAFLRKSPSCLLANRKRSATLDFDSSELRVISHWNEIQNKSKKWRLKWIETKTTESKFKTNQNIIGMEWSSTVVSPKQY